MGQLQLSHLGLGKIQDEARKGFLASSCIIYCLRNGEHAGSIVIIFLGYTKRMGENDSESSELV